MTYIVEKDDRVFEIPNLVCDICQQPFKVGEEIVFESNLCRAHVRCLKEKGYIKKEEDNPLKG